MFLGACEGDTPENIEMALSLTASLNGMEMRSSGSTSDSRYEVPLGPWAGPTMDDRGCEADSLRHERPLAVIWLRREEESEADEDPEAEMVDADPEPSF